MLSPLFWSSLSSLECFVLDRYIMGGEVLWMNAKNVMIIISYVYIVRAIASCTSYRKYLQRIIQPLPMILLQ